MAPRSGALAVIERAYQAFRRNAELIAVVTSAMVVALTIDMVRRR